MGPLEYKMRARPLGAQLPPSNRFFSAAFTFYSLLKVPTMLGSLFSEKVIFIGGPIQYAFNSNGSFDECLKNQICSLINEFERFGYKILSAHRVERFSEQNVTDQTDIITRRDYEWMLNCHAYVCLLPADKEGQPYRSDGTCIELGWASALKKPILIICSSKAQYSHLFKGLGTIANVKYLSIEQIIGNLFLAAEALDSLFQMLAQYPDEVTVNN